jgi:hypothetical protein
VEVVKLLFGLVLVLASVIIVMEWRIKWLFWIGAILMFCRRINFPFIGEIEPSTIVLCLAALLLIHSVTEILLVRYYLQLFVIAFGIFNAYALGNQTNETWTWSLAILIVFIFSALAEIFIKSETELDWLSTVFIIISFVITFTGILGYIGLADGTIILANNSAGSADDYSIYSRTYGIAYNNTVLGYAPISLIFLSEKKWSKVLKIIILFSIVGAVLISLKRLAYLSLFFSAIYILIRERNKIKLLPFLAGSLTIALGIYFYGHVILGRFQDIRDVFLGNESPDVNRTSIMEYALQTIRQHPIAGSGAGYLIFVHNGYLEMAGNLGLMAWGILIPWLYKPFATLVGTADSHQKNWAMSCLIYLSTIFLLEATLSRFELMWIFGLLNAGFLRSIKIYDCGKYDSIKWKKEQLAYQ